MLHSYYILHTFRSTSFSIPLSPALSSGELHQKSMHPAVNRIIDSFTATCTPAPPTKGLDQKNCELQIDKYHHSRALMLHLSCDTSRNSTYILDSFPPSKFQPALLLLKLHLKAQIILAHRTPSHVLVFRVPCFLQQVILRVFDILRVMTPFRRSCNTALTDKTSRPKIKQRISCCFFSSIKNG